MGEVAEEKLETALPTLFIWEEQEIGGGYRTFLVSGGSTRERGWSKPYKKSGAAQYRSRIIAYVPRPLLPTALMKFFGGACVGIGLAVVVGSHDGSGWVLAAIGAFAALVPALRVKSK